MASTTFQDYNSNNPVTAAWLNDVNSATYTPHGTKRSAANAAAAWVKFTVTAGVVAIVQSANINTVVRTGVGVYVVTFVTPMTGASNSYSLAMSSAGFMVFSNESVNGFTITCTNTSNVAFDPASVCAQAFGAN